MHTPRSTCYTCFRPQQLCMCASLKPVHNRTRIVVIQHPREQFHPLSTARIAEGALQNIQVLRGNLSRLRVALERGVVGAGAWLLYPGVGATDLEAVKMEPDPQEIVVLDGTWHQAHTLLRELPQLGRLRCVRFTPAAPSEYRIRREPKPDYLSTIESIAHVLSQLEPETRGIEDLLTAFREMVDRNLAARRHEASPRRVLHEGPRVFSFPPFLHQPPDHVVLTYAEGAALARTASQREPLLALFERLATGERLRIILKSQAPPSPRLLSELGLGVREVETQGLTLDDAQLAVRAFLGDEAELTAWNASSLAMARSLDHPSRAGLQLKGVYCDLKRFGGAAPRSWGSMGEILAHLGLPQVTSEGGRGERRLKQTRALHHWLRDQALPVR